MSENWIVTLGVFDGVHRGHVTLLKRLAEVAVEMNARSLVITFAQHPMEVLEPSRYDGFIQPLYERISAIQSLGIDQVACLDFSREFANLSAEDFLQHIYKRYPFSGLVLGYDTAFGRNKEGGRELISTLADQWGVYLEYVLPVLWKGAPISTTRIREALRSNFQEDVSGMLGR